MPFLDAATPSSEAWAWLVGDVCSPSRIAPFLLFPTPRSPTFSFETPPSMWSVITCVRALASCASARKIFSLRFKSSAAGAQRYVPPWKWWRRRGGCCAARASVVGVLLKLGFVFWAAQPAAEGREAGEPARPEAYAPPRSFEADEYARALQERSVFSMAWLNPVGVAGRLGNSAVLRSCITTTWPCPLPRCWSPWSGGISLLSSLSAFGRTPTARLRRQRHPTPLSLPRFKLSKVSCWMTRLAGLSGLVARGIVWMAKEKERDWQEALLVFALPWAFPVILVG